MHFIFLFLFFCFYIALTCASWQLSWFVNLPVWFWSQLNRAQNTWQPCSVFLCSSKASFVICFLNVLYLLSTDFKHQSVWLLLIDFHKSTILFLTMNGKRKHFLLAFKSIAPEWLTSWNTMSHLITVSLEWRTHVQDTKLHWLIVNWQFLIWHFAMGGVRRED